MMTSCSQRNFSSISEHLSTLHAFQVVTKSASLTQAFYQSLTEFPVEFRLIIRSARLPDNLQFSLHPLRCQRARFQKQGFARSVFDKSFNWIPVYSLNRRLWLQFSLYSPHSFYSKQRAQIRLPLSFSSFSFSVFLCKYIISCVTLNLW